jgi:signal transduction histidine kinase
LATKAYVEGFSQRSGIEAKLHLPRPLPELSKAFELVLFRVLQESLTNVVRHSGSKMVEINLDCAGEAVVLEVTDFGHGIPAHVIDRFSRNLPGGGVGLSGMRERVFELGGRFEINSDSAGTKIKVVLPVARTGEGSLGHDRQAGAGVDGETA